MNNPLNQPAFPAPPGQTSNLIDPPTQTYLCIIVSVIILLCTTPVLCIRMYVNIAIVRDFRFDDGLVLLSYILLVATCGVGNTINKHGGSTDIWNITLGDFMKWQRWLYASELLWVLSILPVKLAILLLYKRAFVPFRLKRRTWVYYTIMAVIFFNIIWYTICFCLFMFACVPIRKIWNPEVPGTCLNVTDNIVSTSAINVFSDICVLVIPPAVIWNLSMPRKRKYEVIAIFAFGVIIIKLVYSIDALHTSNQTVAVMRVALCALCEVAACFLACCVPMVPRFVTHIRTRGNRSMTQIASPSERSPARKNPKESLLRSLFSTVTDDEVEDVEDPYLMVDQVPAETLTTTTDEHVKSPALEKTVNHDIYVVKTVDISHV